MKKWIAVILLAILCLFMVACAADREPNGSAAVNDLTGQTLKLGSQMPNVQLTDALGNSFTLYELLEEKKMVMLNFWFINCPYCVMEFPAIQGAYAQMADEVAIVAVNPYDTASQMISFAKEHELQFTMCPDDPGLSKAFGVSGYPTTVIVDRNGIVCLVQPGAMPYETVFLEVFAHFTAQEYETKLFQSFAEIMN